jgi:Na+-translocating ferredoxin:NAD+ oxidoreductase subunit G
MNLKALWLIPIPVIAGPLHAAEYLTKAEALKVLFNEADEFRDKSVTFSDEQIDKIKELSGVRQRSKTITISQALKKGKLLGVVIIDEVIGKHEYITYATGISSESQVTGVEIMSYRETHGGEIREAGWRKNFKGKKLSDKFKLDVDIPNISGATLSCRNVTDGVKRLLAIQQVLGNG